MVLTPDQNISFRPLFVNLAGECWNKGRRYVLINAASSFVDSSVELLRKIGYEFELIALQASEQNASVFGKSTAHSVEANSLFEGMKIDSLVGWSSNDESFFQRLFFLAQKMSDFATFSVFCLDQAQQADLAQALIRHSIYVIEEANEYLLCSIRRTQWEVENCELRRFPCLTNSIPARALAATRGGNYHSIMETTIVCPEVEEPDGSDRDVRHNHRKYVSRLEIGISDLGALSFHNNTCLFISDQSEIVHESKLWLDFGYLRDFFYSENNTNFKMWRTASFPVTNHVHGPAFVVGAHSQNNYYHFFNDVAPKLWMFAQSRELGLLPENTILIVQAVHPCRFRDDFLDEFESIIGSITRLPAGVTSFSHVIFPGFSDERYELDFKYRARPIEFYAWLKNFSARFITQEIKTNEKIYIARTDTPKRSLVNELDVIELVNSLGFTVIHPSEMSLREQISVMRDAKLVVGPHGAGLFNFQWARFDATLVELKTEVHSDVGFRLLAQMRGSSYKYLDGTPIPVPGKRESDSNMLVDLDKLRALLEIFENS